jgi:hypothetical protein
MPWPAQDAQCRVPGVLRAHILEIAMIADDREQHTVGEGGDESSDECIHPLPRIHARIHVAQVSGAVS